MDSCIILRHVHIMSVNVCHMPQRENLPLAPFLSPFNLTLYLKNCWDKVEVLKIYEETMCRFADHIFILTRLSEVWAVMCFYM